MLAALQELYLLRLDYALQAVYAVQRRSGPASASGDALGEAVEAVRELDAAHLRRVNERPSASSSTGSGRTTGR